VRFVLDQVDPAAAGVTPVWRIGGLHVWVDRQRPSPGG
jgi:hypothetical protein